MTELRLHSRNDACGRAGARDLDAGWYSGVTGGGTMVVWFDADQTDAGWRVVDRRTGLAARIDGMTAEGMDEAEAGEIADLLNTLAFLRRDAAQH